MEVEESNIEYRDRGRKSLCVFGVRIVLFLVTVCGPTSCEFYESFMNRSSHGGKYPVSRCAPWGSGWAILLVRIVLFGGRIVRWEWEGASWEWLNVSLHLTKGTKNYVGGQRNHAFWAFGGFLHVFHLLQNFFVSCPLVVRGWSCWFTSFRLPRLGCHAPVGLRVWIWWVYEFGWDRFTSFGVVVSCHA